MNELAKKIRNAYDAMKDETPINQRGGEPTCPSCGALLPAMADSHTPEPKPFVSNNIAILATLREQHAQLGREATEAYTLHDWKELNRLIAEQQAVRFKIMDIEKLQEQRTELARQITAAEEFRDWAKVRELGPKLSELRRRLDRAGG